MMTTATMTTCTNCNATVIQSDHYFCEKCGSPADGVVEPVHQPTNRHRRRKRDEDCSASASSSVSSGSSSSQKPKEETQEKKTFNPHFEVAGRYLLTQLFNPTANNSVQKKGCHCCSKKMVKRSNRRVPKYEVSVGKRYTSFRLCDSCEEKTGIQAEHLTQAIAMVWGRIEDDEGRMVFMMHRGSEYQIEALRHVTSTDKYDNVVFSNSWKKFQEPNDSDLPKICTDTFKVLNKLGRFLENLPHPWINHSVVYLKMMANQFNAAVDYSGRFGKFSINDAK